MDSILTSVPFDTTNHLISHQLNECTQKKEDSKPFNSHCPPIKQSTALNKTSLVCRDIEHVQSKPSSNRGLRKLFSRLTCGFQSGEKSLLIKINTSKKYKAKFRLSSSEFIKLSFLKFSINGKYFYDIDGNYKDVKLAKSLKKFKNNERMQIMLKTDSNQTYLHTLENKFKENLLRCINEGMMSFYTMQDFSNIIDPYSGKTYGELVGDNIKKPTCCQFTRLIHFGYTSSSECPESIFDMKEINQVDQLPPLSVIQIRFKKNFIHEFFHISNGVCLEKMGSSKIVFIKVDQILKHYKQYLKSENLDLVELVERL